MGSLLSVRSSILAALGFAGLACGATVEVGQQGSTTGSAQGGGGAAGTGGGGGLGGCADPQPVMFRRDTGYVRCADGSVNRGTVATCEHPVSYVSCEGGVRGGSDGCTADADCTDGAYGHCAMDGLGGACRCEYGCVDDLDCDEGEVCLCYGVTNWLNRSQCVPASCRTGDDCPSGECGVRALDSENGCSHEVSCRVPTDECRSVEEGECPGGCRVEGGGGIGRPMIIAGVAHAGDVVARSDWANEAAPAWSAPANDVTAELDGGLGRVRGRLLASLGAC